MVTTPASLAAEEGDGMRVWVWYAHPNHVCVVLLCSACYGALKRNDRRERRLPALYGKNATP